jgi:hypothetical protein
MDRTVKNFYEVRQVIERCEGGREREGEDHSH